jgi:thiol-disulfide isomerase/thioredoxin
MAYLAVVVVALGVLCTFDLLLTLGAIRRLREHTGSLSARGSESPNAIVAAGQRPKPFAAVDTHGLPVHAEVDGTPLLVAFFSPECAPCRELLPEFVAHAARFPGGRPQVLAVISDGPGATEFTRDLVGVARVVVEEPQGPVSTAFQVTGSPAWCLLDSRGVVQDSGSGIDRVPLAVPVPA